MRKITALTLLPIALCCALLLDSANALASKKEVIEENFGGRTMLVYAPVRLSSQGARALVVVLHGGLGNAQRIQSPRSVHGLNLNAVADKGGFVVAYMNGTPVTRFLEVNKLGWNAGGGCCGLPAGKDIDDVNYLKSAIEHLVGQYHIDRSKIFAIGHSNGAMMTQRLMCETSILAATIPISGPLNIQRENCPAANGKRILAIHGEEDENVPVVGGRGSKGLSKAVFNSEERARQTFIKSGASYSLQVVKGADHQIDRIAEIIQQSEGQSIAEKSARFFGLIK